MAALKTHHTLEMQKSLTAFEVRPQTDDAEREKYYLEKLRQKMAGKYPSYKNRALVSNVLKMSACKHLFAAHITA